MDGGTPPLSPAAATISGEGVSPAASAAASGSPPGSAAATCAAEAGRADGLLLEAAQDHALDGRVEARRERRRRGGRSSACLRLQLLQRRAVEGLAAREELVEHEAERVDVASRPTRPCPASCSGAM